MADRLLATSGHDGPSREPLGRGGSSVATAIVIALLILIVHAAGRVAAVCHPYKIDSFTYSIAAYKLWHPGATAADLVADKPPGQAILTGWCYRVFTGEPTRLTLVPVESAFLLGAYAVFFLIARQLHGSRAAGVLTFFFALAQSLYNALDFTTDGFNLNENYLALPMLLAVLAHLTVKRQLWRSLLIGVAVGVALLIKQSAVGLLVALLVSEMVAARSRKRVAGGFAGCGMVAVGVAVAFAPAVFYLWSKGWLGAHLDTLLNLTSSHAVTPPWTLPRWYNISPLMPAIWMVALGVAVRWGNRSESDDRGAPREDDGSGVRSGTFVFLSLWLVIELAFLAAMPKPSSHYYQQIVAPVVLLAGFGLTAIRDGAIRLDGATRAIVRRWVCGTTIVLIVVAVMPLFSAAWGRIGTMDYAAEVRKFAARIAAPTPPIRVDHGGGGK